MLTALWPLEFDAGRGLDSTAFLDLVQFTLYIPLTAVTLNYHGANIRKQIGIQ